MYKSIIEDLSASTRKRETNSNNDCTLELEIERFIQKYAHVYHKGYSGREHAGNLLPAGFIFHVLQNIGLHKNGSTLDNVLYPLKFYFEVALLCYGYAKDASQDRGSPGFLKVQLQKLGNPDDMKMLDDFKSVFGANLEFVASEFYSTLPRDDVHFTKLFPREEYFRTFIQSIHLNDCLQDTIGGEEMEVFKKHWICCARLLEQASTSDGERWWNLASFKRGPARSSL